MFCVEDIYILLLLVGLILLIVYLCLTNYSQPEIKKVEIIESTPCASVNLVNDPEIKEISKPKNQPITYHSAPITQSLDQQVPRIHEIYPVSFTPGGEFAKRGVIALRNVDKPYQDLTTMFQRVGTCHSESHQDDTILTLYRRDVMPERDFYEYKVIDHTNGNNLEIFLSTNITFLRNGDKIIVPGYESKGQFVINLDRQYNYIRLNPF